MITTDLIIANCLSLGSSAFTYASSWAKDERRIYWYQVGQCFVLALAYIFFHSYAGIATLILCTVRNILLATGKYNKTLCIILSVGMVVFGAAVNNNGMIGWIIIAANTIYTIGAFFAKNELLIKLNIILDLALWMVYEVFMKDIPSFIADGIGIAVAIAAIVRYFRTRKSEAAQK